jgi:hypothetical protein
MAASLSVNFTFFNSIKQAFICLFIFQRLATESLFFIGLITHVYIEQSRVGLLFEIIIES